MARLRIGGSGRLIRVSVTIKHTHPKSYLDQINTIKANTLTQMAEVSAERKPTYVEDGQSFSWTQYLDHLQRRRRLVQRAIGRRATVRIPHARIHAMTFDADIDTDCLLIDGTETITLHSTSVVSVEGTKRGRLALAETEFRQVGLNRSISPGICPTCRSPAWCRGRETRSKTPAGHFWTILSANFAPLSGVWRVVTRRQR